MVFCFWLSEAHILDLDNKLFNTEKILDLYIFLFDFINSQPEMHFAS